MSAFLPSCSNYLPCSNSPRCGACQETSSCRVEALRQYLETPDMQHGLDINAGRPCVLELETAEPDERMVAHRRETAKAMSGIAERHGEMDHTHGPPLLPPEASTSARHCWTSSRNWLPVEAIPASPEAISTVPAQQHPEQPHQFTRTPGGLTTTMLLTEKNNGDAAPDQQRVPSGEQANIAAGQEWAPAQTVYSGNSFLQTQTITGQAQETLEDVMHLFKADMDLFRKAVKAYRYDPMTSLHRTATTHVHASRSRTGSDIADQRLAHSNLCSLPVAPGPIRAKHQYAVESPREPLRVDESRPHDDTERLSDDPSREGGNPIEQQIPRPKGGFRKARGRGRNIQEAMGLDADAASQIIYKSIMLSSRELSRQARIDFSKTFSMQEDDRVAEFCRTMRNRHDILRKYEDDWATKAILHQRLNNRRYYMKRTEPRTETSLDGRGTATATAAGTDKENTMNAKDNSCSDADSETLDPAPMGTRLRQAMRQNHPGPSRESLHFDGIRALDRTEQLVDTASREGENPTEQQIPRPKSIGKIKGVGINIRSAMGLDTDAGRRIYDRIERDKIITFVLKDTYTGSVLFS
ncbi:hypothetical protein FA95DRAFT_342553 [Auriscalpium vulgare]|uniref:Uncharacterized protein n=1 Tax=Auriscalpium vulgare TaxID=40419 RepID=A0ACB8RIM2_9AGAM|nr:hypothetical protein FA95DRAFT_342553 [Auriscalpium vulgare]